MVKRDPTNAQLSDLPIWDVGSLGTPQTQDELEIRIRSLAEQADLIESMRLPLLQAESPEIFERILDQLGALHEQASNLLWSLALPRSVDSIDELLASLEDLAERAASEIESRVAFAAEWWISLGDTHAARLLPRNDELHYYLHQMRSKARLPPEVERAISAKAASIQDFNKIRRLLLARMRIASPFGLGQLKFSEIAPGLESADPEIRSRTANALWAAREREAEVHARIFIAQARDRYTDAVVLRKMPSPATAASRANGVTDDVPKGLIRLAEATAPLYQKYLAWKASQIGLDRMSRPHIHAPIMGREPAVIDYKDAVSVVLNCAAKLGEEAHKMATRVFAEGHVHAAQADSKLSGHAFCATPTSSGTPFLFLSYTHDIPSVLRLAHETGHALHSMLAAPRHPLVSQPGPMLAEVASNLMELLAYDELEARGYADPLELEARKLEAIFWGIVQKGYLAKFEYEAHEMVARDASPSSLNVLYLRGQQEMMAGVGVPDSVQHEWTFVHELFEAPFSSYTYSFGTAIAVSLAGAHSIGPSVRESILDLLRLGGSRSPRDALLACCQLDITNPRAYDGSRAYTTSRLDKLIRQCPES